MAAKSFGSFLDAMKTAGDVALAKEHEPQALPDHVLGAAVVRQAFPQPGREEAEIEELLALFPEDREPVAASDLLKASRWRVSDFAQGLDRLRQLGMAEVTATEPEETFALTALGEARAQLSR